MVATAFAHAAVRPTAAVTQQRGFGARRVSLAAPVGKTWSQRTVSNGVKTRAMMIWQPVDNKMFETMSFLPPLTSDQIAKQVDYIVQNNRVPCLEFAEAEGAYVKDVHATRIRGTNMCNYVDNRYWTMWKLPMFGCTDPGQVLTEIDLATKAFPDAYIRLVAFDSVRQVQITSILVHRPTSASDYRLPENRSVQG